MVQYFICKGCNKEIKGKNLGRVFNLICSLEDYCKKCSMNSARHLDRKGKSSKKDKYKNKSERMWHL